MEYIVIGMGLYVDNMEQEQGMHHSTMIIYMAYTCIYMYNTYNH